MMEKAGINRDLRMEILLSKTNYFRGTLGDSVS